MGSHWEHFIEQEQFGHWNPLLSLRQHFATFEDLMSRILKDYNIPAANSQGYCLNVYSIMTQYI